MSSSALRDFANMSSGSFNTHNNHPTVHQKIEAITEQIAILQIQLSDIEGSENFNMDTYNRISALIAELYQDLDWEYSIIKQESSVSNTSSTSIKQESLGSLYCSYEYQALNGTIYNCGMRRDKIDNFGNYRCLNHVNMESSVNRSSAPTISTDKKSYHYQPYDNRSLEYRECTYCYFIRIVIERKNFQL